MTSTVPQVIIVRCPDADGERLGLTKSGYGWLWHGSITKLLDWMEDDTDHLTIYKSVKHPGFLEAEY